jgi:ElaB/YqjD/DUF883 family membrane-anchored ribosome-binding protein
MADQWLKRESSSMLGWVKETHPSYGMIGVCRVSGNASLFDSEVSHMHYISICIKNAHRVIEGTHEFLSADSTISEVHMTEAQFAQMMTQPNQGDGVACTIHFSAGDKGEPWLNPEWGTRPEPPKPERFEAKFHKEASDRAQVIIDNLAKLAATIDSFLSGEAKANKGTLTELKNSLTSATQQIKSNIPYVLEVASERLEKKISSAVIEFESYVSQSLQAKGLSNLIADAPRLTIGEQKALPDGEQEPE